MSRKRKIKFIFLLGITIALVFAVFRTQAEDSISDLSKEEKKELEETQNKIKELEDKAKTYEQIIDMKRKQQQTLADQISLIEAEAQKIEAEININKEKIEELNKKISELFNQIESQEDISRAQKQLLSKLLRSYYEYNKDEDVSFIFSDDTFASFGVQEDRLGQTGSKIKDVLNHVQSIKSSLEDEKKEAEEKKKEIAELYLDQQERSSELNNNIAQKEALVTQTRGEESRYQQLLSRVEAQKQELLGDIDELYSANTDEINKVLAGLPKPKTGLASTNWFYSQKDSRWGNMRIGQSNSLVKDYGCALTSVAMIFTYYDETTTPANLCRQRIFYWDLIVWPDGKKVKLVKNTNHGGVSWSEIDRELNKGNPVIVFVKARGNAGHYLVIHHKTGSDYVVHDPYFGSNIYLNSSIKLLSALYKTSISKSAINQMVIYEKK